MSLVESWPSTEMRSNERFTHTPVSRSTRLRREPRRRSARSRTSWRSAARSSRRPWPGPTAAPCRDGSSTSRQARFGPAVAGQDRLGEDAGVARRAPRRRRARRRAPARAAARVPITPVEATPTWSGSTPSASAAAACWPARSRGRAGRRPRSSAPALAATARSAVEPRLARDHHGRAHARVGGEARGGHRVRLVAHEHAHVEALGLEPGGHARRPGSRAGSAGGLELGHVRRALDPARAEEASRSTGSLRAPPSRAGRASGSGPAPPGRRRPSRGCRSRRRRSCRSPTTVTCTRQRLVSRTCARVRRLVRPRPRTARRRRRRGRGRARLVLGQARDGQVAAGQDALVERQQVGHEAEAPPARAPARARRCGGGPRPCRRSRSRPPTT